MQNTSQKTKDWATQALLKTGSELRYSRRVSTSCFTSGTRCVTIVTNPMKSYEEEKADATVTTNAHYATLMTVRQIEHTRVHLCHIYS